ncbi:MAG: MFS transporter [Pseudomonadota bacterium]
MLAFYRDNARWLAGGFLLAMFSGFGQTFFISMWGNEIRETFDLTHGGFGLVYMLATLASALSLPFVGRLVDVTSVAVSAIIVVSLLTVACLLMGSVTSLPLLVFTIYLLRLFGQGMMTQTSMTAMGRWYVSNRGKAVSFAAIGHQASEALFPTLFALVALSLGWRMTWWAAAGFLFFVALPLIVLLMRVERIPRGDAARDSATQETGRQWTRGELLRDPLFWLVCVGVLGPPFIGTAIFFHQDYLIELNGWNPQLYYNAFIVMALTTVLFSLGTGFAIDRWSAVQMLPFFMVPLGAGCFVLGSFSSEGTIFVFMLLLGMSYGITSALFGALWPEVWGTRNLGAIRSIVVAMMVFLTAAGPGLTGVLIDYGISFPQQLIFMGMYCAAAFFVMIVASQKLQVRMGTAVGIP